MCFSLHLIGWVSLWFSVTVLLAKMKQENTDMHILQEYIQYIMFLVKRNTIIRQTFYNISAQIWDACYGVTGVCAKNINDIVECKSSAPTMGTPRSSRTCDSFLMLYQNIRVHIRWRRPWRTEPCGTKTFLRVYRYKSPGFGQFFTLIGLFNLVGSVKSVQIPHTYSHCQTKTMFILCHVRYLKYNIIRLKCHRKIWNCVDSCASLLQMTLQLLLTMYVGHNIHRILFAF